MASSSPAAAAAMRARLDGIEPLARQESTRDGLDLHPVFVDERGSAPAQLAFAAALLLGIARDDLEPSTGVLIVLLCAHANGLGLRWIEAELSGCAVVQDEEC